MWLLDTMVISELRKHAPDPHVAAWLADKSEKSLFLSVVTVSEIQRGIVRQQVKDAVFAERLKKWLDTLVRNYGDRILPVTAEIARKWGTLSAQVGHDGADVIIAATALHHGLTVVTRNERHFAPLSVPVSNPFDEQGIRFV
jgi:predicted nucleic acid-binding protein